MIATFRGGVQEKIQKGAHVRVVDVANEGDVFVTINRNALRISLLLPAKSLLDNGDG